MLFRSDLILRGAEPASKADNWLGAEQGPMAFEEVKGDFVVVTRVEALSRSRETNVSNRGTSPVSSRAHRAAAANG